MSGYRAALWRVLIPLIFLAVAATGVAVGQKTAKPCCVYFQWLYDPNATSPRPVSSGNDVVLFGTRGRQWTARISLNSCQWYRKGYGYPPCPKAERVP